MARSGSFLTRLYHSPVGKKVATAVTGIGLTLFALAHMSGNLAYFSGPDAYNAYSHFLISLGPVFYAIEIGLLAFFVFHITIGVNIWLGKRRARPVGYHSYKSAGQPSRQTVASKSMIITGLILFAFVVFHVVTLKYGTWYDTVVDGVPMRDIARLVDEKFQDPLYAFGYPAVMLLLSMHLRHGIWSALQSLGAVKPSMTPVVYLVGALIALLIGVGFLILPLAIYFGLV